MTSSTRTINCEKWEGAGNDFVIVENLSLTKEEIASICHRQRGIGADGVIVCMPHKDALCRMRIFNADGSEAEMCGNGLRALFGYGGWTRGEIVSSGHRHLCWKSGDLIATQMGPPKIVEECDDYILLDTGVPHAVLFAYRDAKSLRQKLNANVTWFSDGRVKTFERGVEAVTLGCGTGIAAAHCALFLRHKAKECETIISAGGTPFLSQLDISSSGIEEITLHAPVRRVFSGTVFLNYVKLQHRVSENSGEGLKILKS